MKFQDMPYERVDFAQVEKEKLLISGFEINRGAKYTVEFAQSPYYEINLYNAAQIPALPFRLQI